MRHADRSVKRDCRSAGTVYNADRDVRIAENFAQLSCDVGRHVRFRSAAGKDLFAGLFKAVQKAFGRQSAPPIIFETAGNIDVDKVAEMNEAFARLSDAANGERKEKCSEKQQMKGERSFHADFNRRRPRRGRPFCASFDAAATVPFPERQIPKIQDCSYHIKGYSGTRTSTKAASGGNRGE